MQSQKLEQTSISQFNQPKQSFIGQMTVKDILFILALATKPLYLRASGSIQISEVLFVMLFGLLVFSGAPLFQSRHEAMWIAWFTICLIYQLLINTYWYFQLQETSISDFSLLKSCLYYVFNFLVCLSILQLRSLKGYEYTLKLFLLGTFLSVFVSVVGVALQYRGSGRATGFFNNPNQLGYFCIVAMTVVTFFSKKIKPSMRLVIIVLCLGMSMISLSKASIVASAILMFVYFINSRDRMGSAKLVSILLSILVVSIAIYIIMYADWDFLNNSKIISDIRVRLGGIVSENDSNLGTGRGYDRVKEIGNLIVIGVGEGAYIRFVSMRAREVHSLYAGFLVSYGIIGLSMLLWIVGKALFSQKRYLRNLLSFSGIIAYCITHNGIRSTLLWALLAMLLIRPRESVLLSAPWRQEQNAVKDDGKAFHPVQFCPEEKGNGG